MCLISILLFKIAGGKSQVAIDNLRLNLLADAVTTLSHILFFPLVLKDAISYSIPLPICSLSYYEEEEKFNF